VPSGGVCQGCSLVGELYLLALQPALQRGNLPLSPEHRLLTLLHISEAGSGCQPLLGHSCRLGRHAGGSAVQLARLAAGLALHSLCFCPSGLQLGSRLGQLAAGPFLLAACHFEVGLGSNQALLAIVQGSLAHRKLLRGPG
jgi:hypothetical protein